MNLAGRRVLLAGATGLAGAAITERILADYPRVRLRAVFHKKHGFFMKDRRIEYVGADLRSYDDCLRVCRGADAAIMAAAQTGGAQASVQKPWSQVTDNAVMYTHFFDACHRQGIRRIVCLGSASLYQPKNGLLGEDDLKLDQDPYPAHFGIGWVMRFVEKLGQFWHEKTGMETVVARCANIYGPFASFDPGRANFIPALIRKAVDKKDPFEVWGSPCVRRDVVYADDTARAALAMLRAKDMAFEIFNIGSGEAVRVDKVVDVILKYAGHKPRKIAYLSDKPTTFPGRVLDCGKARRLLKWSPEISLEEGIQRTVFWWQENRRRWKK